MNETNLKIYYLEEDSTIWEECTIQGINLELNYVWANVKVFPFRIAGTEISIARDANNDFKVNQKNVAIVAEAYNTRPGDIKCDPRADINGDSKVDVKDVAIVAKYYGSHYP